MASKYKGLERDANALIKATLFEIEEAAGQDPQIAAHPDVLELRKKRIVRRVWGLVKRCMTMLEDDYDAR